jgi:hypothetical protein
MRLVTVGACVGVLVVGSARADTDSLNDSLGPREIAVGEAMRGGAVGASAIGLNPSGLPMNHELVFEGGYGYRASDSASLIGVSACDSTNEMPGCFFYQYAGANPDLDGVSSHSASHVAGLSLSRMLTPHIFIGGTAKYFHFNDDLMTTNNGSGFNWDIGTTLRISDMVSMGVAGYNLFGSDNPQFPRAVGGGVLARPIPALTASFDARWRLQDDKSARYGGGLEYFFSGQGGQNGYPIRAGVLHDNGLGATYISAGLGLSSIKYGIDVAARKEVKGGDETMIIASMRFFGPRLGATPLDAAGE